MKNPRRHYSRLKSIVLDAYFDACYELAIAKGYSHEEVMGEIIKRFENATTCPAERLMLVIILYVLCGGWLLCGGWFPEWHKRLHESIVRQISNGGLERILAEIPEDIQEGDEESEKEVLVADIRILDFISDFWQASGATVQ
ncbi:MAG: hypothetical protein LBB76_03605 [Azoarcus sp.]|jgi:hypothetical protein|nr:hypothetical protein [Azoarcus sp.]